MQEFFVQFVHFLLVHDITHQAYGSFSLGSLQSISHRGISQRAAAGSEAAKNMARCLVSWQDAKYRVLRLKPGLNDSHLDRS